MSNYTYIPGFSRKLTRAEILALTSYENGKVYFATDGGIFVSYSDHIEERANLTPAAMAIDDATAYAAAGNYADAKSVHDIIAENERVTAYALNDLNDRTTDLEDNALFNVNKGTEGRFVNLSVSDKANNEQTIGISVSYINSYQGVSNSTQANDYLATAYAVRDYVGQAVAGNVEWDNVRQKPFSTVTEANGLAIADDALVMNVGSTSAKGAVQVTAENGLSITDGVVAMAKAGATTYGAVAVTTGNGLALADGIITMSQASTSAYGAVQLDSAVTSGSGNVATSGATYTAIQNAVEALDSNITATTGYVLTGVTITDGKLTAKTETLLSQYTISKAETAETSYFATYKLMKDGAQVGDSINIPKDFLVKSAELKTVTVADQPYTGAEVGDKYIDFIINSKDASETADHIYLPVNDLVDVYTADESTLQLSSYNVFSVKDKGITYDKLGDDVTAYLTSEVTITGETAITASDFVDVAVTVDNEGTAYTVTSYAAVTTYSDIANAGSATANNGLATAYDVRTFVESRLCWDDEA